MCLIKRNVIVVLWSRGVLKTVSFCMKFCIPVCTKKNHVVKNTFTVKTNGVLLGLVF